MGYNPKLDMSKQQIDSGGDTVEKQAEALQNALSDTGDPQVAAPPTDAPKAEKDWKTEVSALGVDPGWVVRLRMKLVDSGKISMDDIQADKLSDPEHRKWLNKMLKENNDAEAAATSTPAVSTPASTETAPQTSTAPKPSVLKPGHLPTGEIWHSDNVPAGDGWLPAGNGLFWPPYPVTGGPIEKPVVQSATLQATALDQSTGQVRPEATGG